MAAKYKYNIGGGELVIKDLKAVPDTYQEGEVLVAGAAEGGGVRSAAAGIAASIIGVSNQGETLPAASGFSGPGITLANDGATLTGLQSAGKVENLKVIVNPDAVYAIEYSQASPLTSAALDTSITFTSAGAGFAGAGGGWFWSYDTGELDYVVSSAVGAGDTVLTTVTGTDTAGVLGILLQPAQCGQSLPLELTADALSIAANADDVGVAGTNAVNGIILENRIESAIHGSEILDCVTMNQLVRGMNTSTVNLDKAKAFAYVKFASVLAA